MSIQFWLYLHLASTAFMTGVISICHWVHYPLMTLADQEQFPEFSRRHQRRISWIVVPCMAIELICALRIAGSVSQNMQLRWLGLALLAGIWISTTAVQSRQHHRLRDGYDKKVLDQLLRQNRPRVFLWWTRLAVAILLLIAQVE